MFRDTGALTRLTDSADHKVPTARTEENVDLVNDFVLNWEDTPQTHRTVCEILIITEMLWNYHHEFGSCLLLEHSLICKKCIKFEQFNFIEVVRQHILGVVGNVTHCFVGNLTDFPAVKE